MKDWTEQPHLFANGKFNIIHAGGIVDWVSIYANGKLRLWDGHGYFESEAQNCSLVARPIQQMTDKEVSWFWQNDQLTYDVDDVENIKGSFCGSFYEDYPFAFPVPEMLYLLSIGVYPFDQKAFNNDNLIKASEVT